MDTYHQSILGSVWLMSLPDVADVLPAIHGEMGPDCRAVVVDLIIGVVIVTVSVRDNVDEAAIVPANRITHTVIAIDFDQLVSSNT